MFTLCPELTFLCSTCCRELTAKITVNLLQNTTKKRNVYQLLSFCLFRIKLWKVRQRHVFILLVLLWLKKVSGVGGLVDGADCSSAFHLNGISNWKGHQHIRTQILSASLCLYWVLITYAKHERPTPPALEILI